MIGQNNSAFFYVLDYDGGRTHIKTKRHRVGRLRGEGSRHRTSQKHLGNGERFFQHVGRVDWYAPDDNSELYALREGLVNMLAHADYFSPMHSTVRVFSNRIEFQNAGRFMFDLKDLRTQMHSMPRNPLLVKLFRFAKLSENAGYGIDKMLTWERLTHNSVEFSSDLVCSTITCFRTNSDDGLRNHVGGVKENPYENLGSLDNAILAAIRQNPRITQGELSGLTGKHKDTIYAHIKMLRQKGLIIRVGPDKGGYWKIN